MPQPDLRLPDLRLIVITDRALAAPRALEDVVRYALLGGARTVQLRDKDATAAELLAQARVLLPLVRTVGGHLFINDRVDVALAAGADGVHLGPDDIPVAAARRAAPGLLIGYSSDDPALAAAAERDGASYIGCGAVFGTTTKASVGAERIGVERLAEVVDAVGIPVVGIGGIRRSNIADIVRTGAAGAAVVREIMTAEDTAGVVDELLRAFR